MNEIIGFVDIKRLKDLISIQNDNNQLHYLQTK